MKFRLLLVMLIAISEAAQWYGVLFYKFGKEYNAVENALYAALYRWMFLLPYAFLGVQHLTSGLGKCEYKASRYWLKNIMVRLFRNCLKHDPESKYLGSVGSTHLFRILHQ